MAGRTEAGHWYDGPVYAAVVDRMLDGVRNYVAGHLPAGERVLDACCGTGALSRRLAEDGRTVVGVDLSARHIRYARSHAGSSSARFRVGDVAELTVPSAGPYDVATIVLALHEMPRELRGPVLDRLLAVARRVMVVDFVAPMPRNVAGLRNRATELAAGWEHFAAFRDWQAQLGLGALLERTGATVESDRTIDAGTLRVLTLAPRGA
ncbi:class I SAM-dependent methyltransferase [Myceligenerans indicum]|uniref:Class I SAM-dependent methyltransferase n=1 Tax=Myceligenerans indicum TaxID=2593663 RepID=A0ABS1LPB7_9MICO|nr:class I SAM-dependent methyltransferase [Myceligenerans indicum]MBL0888072.1 class I SAM-dependent methyltransferase [Myceligenerans indicum]